MPFFSPTPHFSQVYSVNFLPFPPLFQRNPIYSNLLLPFFRLPRPALSLVSLRCKLADREPEAKGLSSKQQSGLNSNVSNFWTNTQKTQKVSPLSLFLSWHLWACTQLLCNFSSSLTIQLSGRLRTGVKVDRRVRDRERWCLPSWSHGRNPSRSFDGAEHS